MAARIVRIVFLLLGLACIGLAIQRYSINAADQKKDEDQRLSDSRHTVLKMALDINSRVSRIVDTTRLMARDFTKGLKSSELTPDLI